MGALPNLIVIGAQKCGTSGLHYYLSLHPETSMSKPKELNFFIAERNFPRGLDWYRAHFDARATVRGESSPNYTAYPQHVGVPERMHAIVPDAKLLYMVRDPIDRIAAHWVHNFAKRREKGDLRATLMHPNTSYLARSHYYTQLQQFLRVYPREQILLVEQDELRDQPHGDAAEGVRVHRRRSGLPRTRASPMSATRPRARPGRRRSRCGWSGSGRRPRGRVIPRHVLAGGGRPVPLPADDRGARRPRSAVGPRPFAPCGRTPSASAS